MDYEQFKVYMKESVETVTGRKVTVHPLLHNNSLVRDSLSIDTPLGHRQGLRLFCGITISSMRKELLRACW